MNNIERSHEEEEEDEDESDSSSLNRLPDELILQILTKITDLKTLCFIHLVSKRFSSIVLQIDTISFIVPQISRSQNPSSDTTASCHVDTTGLFQTLFQQLLNGVVLKPIHLLKRMLLPASKPFPPIISSFYDDSFRSAVSFLNKFNSVVKSLSIELPCSNHIGVDSSCLYKWKVRFSNRIELFMFLSPNSIHDIRTDNLFTEEVDMELGTELCKQKVHIAFQCLKDVIMRHRMLLYFAKDLPNLEKLSITDSDRRGTVCFSGEKLAEVREWMCSAPDNVKLEMNRIEVPVNVSQCYVPVLYLPDSGYVMKGVTFVQMWMSNNIQDGIDCLMNFDGGYEDMVEVAYLEAMMEISRNHGDKMKRLL